MDESVIRRKVAEARVARVGTLDERGSVHLVPVGRYREVSARLEDLR